MLSFKTYIYIHCYILVVEAMQNIIWCSVTNLSFLILLLLLLF